MTQQIWIVFGTTGEYSDRSEWPVAAYDSEKAAQDRVKALQHALEESGIERLDRYEGPWEKAVDEFKAKHDPGFHIDYTGTSWYLATCEFHSGYSEQGPDRG